MATGVVSWSQTANSNDTADSNVNWAEGQAPATVNNSARALMASAAKYRDDIAGAIVTGGTSTAYTVTSFQGFGSFAAMHQQIIAFSPHTTNGTPCQLNVDSLGNKPLRTASGVELVAGALAQGAPYTALYNNSDGAFYLKDFNPAGTGLSNSAGTLTVALSKLTNSLGSDVLLNNTGTYFTGPTVAQGTSGTWFASGTVTLTDSSTAGAMVAKLWDGTTVIASGSINITATAATSIIALSGYITSPAGNIRISCKDTASTSGKILFNVTGNSMDSTLSVIRIG